MNTKLLLGLILAASVMIMIELGTFSKEFSLIVLLVVGIPAGILCIWGVIIESKKRKKST